MRNSKLAHILVSFETNPIVPRLESKLVNTSSETNLLRSEVRLLTSRLDHSPVIRRHRSLNVVEELSDSQTSV